MEKVLIIYVIVQLITSAYGLAVIESVTPLVEKRLKDKGYTKNQNSLYNFNSSATDLLKVFVPFYYLSKAISIISNKNSSVDKKVDEEIKKGRYINEEDLPTVQVIEEEPAPVVEVKEPEVTFEREVYKARRNAVDLLLNTYETPVEYEERVASKEEGIELTPFVSTEKPVNHIVVNRDITKADIAKAISELSADEIESLSNRLIELVSIKRKNNTLKLEKDIDKAA
jgi:hypothetical protein